MGEKYGRLAGHPRIAIGGVRCDLLVPDTDKMKLAVRHRRKDGDVGMAAQAKDVCYATAFEIPDQLVRYEITHGRILAD
jgi:hypothetical protein